MWQELANDLIDIFNNKAYLSIVLDNRIKKDNDLNKNLYTKILYGVVEKKLYLDYVMAPYTKGVRIKPYLKNILRIGAYSLIYLNLKDYYIINELVETIKKTDYNGSKLCNAILRNLDRRNLRKIDNKNIKDYYSILLSIPHPLIDLLYDQYQDHIKDFYLNYEGLNCYRINNIKINDDTFYQLLDNEQIEYEKIKHGFYTKHSLIATSFFQNGLILSQDEASMMVSETLFELIPKNDLKDVQILDCCGAPGSKSLYLASLINNQGHIDCCDIYENKIKKIKDNLIKCGVTNTTAYLFDATSPNPKIYDYIICDVPCSGLGTINHKPDLKYRLELKDLDEINTLQKKILNSAKNSLKIGGILQYSTCTINKKENEETIEEFLKQNPNYKKIKEIKVLPSSKHDGFYICDLKRVG